MAAFGAWDYAVMILMLLVSAGIGLYYRLTGGKQKTTKVLSGLLGLLRKNYNLKYKQMI